MLALGFIASDTRRQVARITGRLTRKGQPTIQYFHQVDDPYSHLAVQKVDALATRYGVKFEFHLVQNPTNEEQCVGLCIMCYIFHVFSESRPKVVHTYSRDGPSTFQKLSNVFQKSVSKLRRC